MNVTRYDLRIVNRYAGDGTGEIETDATMAAGPHGRYVSYEDYQRLESENKQQAALLAETQELRKEIDTLISLANSNADQSVRLDKEINRLSQDAARFRKDATRYRILRQMRWNDGPLAVVTNPKANVKLGADCLSGERLDEMLDETASQPVNT